MNYVRPGDSTKHWGLKIVLPVFKTEAKCLYQPFMLTGGPSARTGPRRHGHVRGNVNQMHSIEAGSQRWMSLPSYSHTNRTTEVVNYLWNSSSDLVTCVTFVYLLLSLLGWHWLIKSCRFGVQLYNTGYCIVFTTPSQVSFHPLFTLLYFPHPLPSGHQHTVVCVYECFLLSPLPFSPSLPSPSPLTAVSLFSIFRSLFPCCLLVDFVH